MSKPRKPMQCRAKKSYTEQKAIEAAAFYKQHNGALQQPYKCQFCEQYHLTKGNAQ